MGDAITLRMLISNLAIPSTYYSLIVKLNSIYGPELSIESFLRISDYELSTHRGIGKTYLSRFKTLKVLLHKLYSEDSFQLTSTNTYEKMRNRDITDSALFHKIQECFPHVKSRNDIFSISPDEFASFPGVGRGKVQQLINIQAALAIDVQNTSENIAILTQLESYRFLFLHLSSSDEKLLKKIEKSDFYSGDITPSDICKIQESEFISWGGIGKNSCTVLHALQNRIRESLLNKDSGSILIHDRFGESLTLKELEPLLKEDIEKFYSKLSGNNEVIWCSRLGYLTEPLTLQETGENLSVTRERVRQVEAKLNQRFLRSLRIRPNLIHDKIQNITRVELFNTLKDLRSLFHTDNDMIRMLALISNVNTRDLVLRFNPTIKNNVLDDFLFWTSYPAVRPKVISFLHEEIGGTDEEIDNYFSAMITANIICIKGFYVIPIRLGKELAIAHILSGYPEGLDWREISIKVNKSSICHTSLSGERPDPNLTFSSYFFQSGQRTYSHITFLPIASKEFGKIVEDVKLAIKSSQYNSLHLMAEYYAKLDSPEHDYYVIRHVIRNYGEIYGVFFNGKSQSDTVSLQPITKTVSQKAAIKRLFSENDMPFSVKEITSHIKSQSEAHAKLYLEELIESGDVVAIDINQYQARDKAYSEIDIESIKKLILRMITEDSRLHYLSVITHHINQLYSYDYSNRFWRSLMVAYSKEMGWYIKGMLISMNRIEIRGLSELVKKNSGKSQEDIIASIQQDVCVSIGEIKRVIHLENSKSENITLNTDRTVGLASDIMEELFTL
jgi:hypothetical protein